MITASKSRGQKAGAGLFQCCVFQHVLPVGACTVSAQCRLLSSAGWVGADMSMSWWVLPTMLLPLQTTPRCAAS